MIAQFGGFVDVTGVLVIVLVVVGIVAAGTSIWASIEIARMSRSLRTTSDDLNAKAGPVLDKADASLDLLNAELMRVDGIVTQVEEVSDRVTTTSDAVTGVVRAPIAFAVAFADRLRKSGEQKDFGA